MVTMLFSDIAKKKREEKNDRRPFGTNKLESELITVESIKKAKDLFFTHKDSSDILQNIYNYMK